MELKEFVSSTLSQIAEGILEAQQHALKNNYTISPEPSRSQTMIADATLNGSLPGGTSPVEFDIALTTTSTQGAEARAKVVIFNASIGGNSVENSQSRIKFTIGVNWPTMSR